MIRDRAAILRIRQSRPDHGRYDAWSAPEAAPVLLSRVDEGIAGFHDLDQFSDEDIARLARRHPLSHVAAAFQVSADEIRERLPPSVRAQSRTPVFLDEVSVDFDPAAREPEIPARPGRRGRRT